LRKNKVRNVEKKWGSEVWLVNNKEYCGKLLYLQQEAESSYHYHNIKRETFYCLQGQVDLRVEGEHYQLNPFAEPITVEPGEKHSFYGVTEAVIIEISTHHDDKDVVRITESSRLLV